jgi:hypothetical protein
MPRSRILLFCLSMSWAAGCTFDGEDWHLAADEDATRTPEDDPIAPQPLRCNGICVGTAPATYTGPSLFWLGTPHLAPECPSETPYQGLEGYIADQQTPVFARECRITPSDLCDDEGLTCTPLPEEDFHVCIHHENASPCPADYPERSTLSELETQMTVTLCCQKSPVST